MSKYKTEFEYKSYLVHTPKHFDDPAHSCWDAAIRRNIYLEEELKTLLFNIDGKMFLYHGLGNRLVNITKLRAFGSSIRLASTNFLNYYRLDKGSINPFNVIESGIELENVLICSSVFQLNKVYTNDGTFFGTYAFHPSILLLFYNNYIIDDYASIEWEYFSVPLLHKIERSVYTFIGIKKNIHLLKNPYVWNPTKFSKLFEKVYICENFNDKYVCDVGTGSGILGISAAINGANVLALDLNPFAVSQTIINSTINNVNVTAVLSNCFSALDNTHYNLFDYILCNPPTLPCSENRSKDEAIIWNENENGRFVLDKVIEDSSKYLKIGGKLFILSSSHQDWNLTVKNLNKNFQKWRLLHKQHLLFGGIYQIYEKEWTAKGFIEIIGNNKYLTVKLIEAIKN